MKSMRLPALILCLCILCGCENFSVSDEINGIICKNDLAIAMKTKDAGHDATIQSVKNDEQANESFLKIDVAGKFTARGEASIEPGRKYRLTIVMKNESADPVVLYSFWEDSVTMKRHFTFNGQDGNPPQSETQAIHDDWVAYEETLEAKENEKRIMLTILSGQGTFFIKQMNIEMLGE